jgi:hypothetical protein
MSHSTQFAVQALQQQVRQALARPDHALAVAATPEYPLMFNARMPDGHAFTQGNLSLRFSAMSGQGLQHIEVKGVTRSAEANRYRLELRVPQLLLQGEYSVDAINSPEIALDHGGSMMEFNGASDYQPAGANGTITPLPPEQKADMLDLARDQKDHLRNTPNGQALLNTFNEHNETFNTVFVTSPAARAAWAANGVTQAMAVDTHQAVKSDTVVNSSTKLYAPNVTYNSNAFNQQLQMVVNTVAADPDFNPFDPDSTLDPNSPYVKASLAAMTFNTAVGQTGNDKANVNELTASGVYGQVQQQTPPPPSSVDQLKNIIDQGAGAGGAVETARKNKWTILDEEDRAKVRRFLFHSIEERLQKMNLKPEPLWQGGCSATVDNVTASVEIEIDARRQCVVRQCRFDIPAFALEIDDAAWTGELAQKARERINQIFFIKRMLHDQVQSGLKKALEHCLPALEGQQIQMAAT